MNSVFSKDTLSDKRNATINNRSLSESKVNKVLTPNTTANIIYLDKKTTPNTSGPTKRKRNDSTVSRSCRGYSLFQFILFFTPNCFYFLSFFFQTALEILRSLKKLQNKKKRIDNVRSPTRKKQKQKIYSAILLGN